MSTESPYTIELLKLANGSRVLRVYDSQTATCLERVVRPDVPVTRQKDCLSQALQSLLERELRENATAA